MFCNKCGRPQPEGTQFCEACGNPMNPPLEPIKGASPPPTGGTTPPRPPMPPPKKSNTLLYVLLGVAVVALAGVVVAVILLTSPAKQVTAPATPAPTSAAVVTPYVPPTAAPTAAYTPAPTATSGVSALRVYDTPGFATGVLESKLPGSTWELAGIATNEDQAGGSTGTYTLDKFEGYTMRLVFGTDGVLTVTRGYLGTDETPFKLKYDINDTFCQCEDDGGGNIARFYLGTDGNLYLTFVSGDKEMYDFNVFSLSF
ncbi:MAG: zinc ribbon domain-containing protein [Clostridiales bacterium]|jgi:hypothetical protein|nr:zinc ribbon domain-containing protein [Clostridiales bacterium]